MPCDAVGVSRYQYVNEELEDAVDEVRELLMEWFGRRDAWEEVYERNVSYEAKFVQQTQTGAVPVRIKIDANGVIQNLVDGGTYEDAIPILSFLAQSFGQEFPWVDLSNYVVEQHRHDHNGQHVLNTISN